MSGTDCSGTGGRVFLHHDGALGDVLLSLPSLRKLRETAACMHLACRSDAGQLLIGAGLVDELSRVDSILYSPLYGDPPYDWSCGALSSFDRAYLFTAGDSRFADNVRICIPDVRVVRTIPPVGSTEHAALFRLRQCGENGELPDGSPLMLPKEGVEWAERMLAGHGFVRGRDRMLVVHPGSGGIIKCWSLANYLELMNSILRDQLIWCVVLSGPAEPRGTVDALQALSLRHARVIHIRNEPLVHVAAVLLGADYYLGNDSGISHLAGVMQCRGTVLFGPTDPAIWRPLGGQLRTVSFAGDNGLYGRLGLQILSDIRTGLMVPSG